MNIKPVRYNDRESWCAAVYDALDEVQDWSSSNGSCMTDEQHSESSDKNKDEVMTAMAWICESLGIDPANL